MIGVGIIGAVIVGLVEAFKKTGFLPSKWSALLAIALGVVIFFFIGEGETVMNVFDGIIAGLTAAGLYSGTKATLEK